MRNSVRFTCAVLLKLASYHYVVPELCFFSKFIMTKEESNRDTLYLVSERKTPCLDIISSKQLLHSAQQYYGPIRVKYRHEEEQSLSSSSWLRWPQLLHGRVILSRTMAVLLVAASETSEIKTVNCYNFSYYHLCSPLHVDRQPMLYEQQWTNCYRKLSNPTQSV